MSNELQTNETNSDGQLETTAVHPEGNGSEDNGIEEKSFTETEVKAFIKQAVGAVTNKKRQKLAQYFGSMI